MTPEQLKNSILQLAIQGKLVEQRKEEYVSTALFNAKKNTGMEILGFEIPNNWELSTIEGIANVISTKKYQIRESEILKDGLYPVISQSKEAVIGYSNDKNKLLVINKPVIIFGDHTTIVKYIDFDFVVGADGIKIFEPISDIEPKFFKYTIDFLSIGLEKKGGYSRHYKFIKHLSLPVPPLAEQKRIVEKIEELLPLVDRYEKAWTRLEDLNKKFPLDMQKSILQEAIQGKLVEQRKEEGTGEKLFKEIQNEKQKLVEEGKLKERKSLPEITDEEIPFDIPETWKWVRSSDILNITMGQSPKSDSINYDNIGCEFHQGKSNFGNKFLNTSNVYTMSNNKIIESPAIVMSVRAPVGDVNLIKHQIFIGRGLASFQTYTKCNLDYIFYYFLTIKKSLESVSTGSTFKAINSTTVINFLVPLPPLAEQKRIVEKIEELLPLCEKLK